MTAPPLHVGIDVAKAGLDVCVLPTGQTLSVNNDDDGIAQIIALLKQQHAVIRPAEVVANIADRARPDGIDLHHLTSAVRIQAKGQPVHILVRG